MKITRFSQKMFSRTVFTLLVDMLFPAEYEVGTEAEITFLPVHMISSRRDFIWTGHLAKFHSSHGQLKEVTSIDRSRRRAMEGK